VPEVVFIATFTVKPGNEDEVERILRGLIEPSQADVGCIKYALHRGLDDPSSFAMVERWTSREALDDHLQQPHVAAVAEALPLLEGQPHVLFSEPLPVGDEAKGTL